MQLLKKHIALLGLLVFLLPTAISLHHSFENHEHSIVCHSKDEKHLHKDVDVDCDLCDFTTFSFLQPAFKTQLFADVLATKFYPNNYNFLTSFKRLFFSLRAPPSLV